MKSNKKLILLSNKSNNKLILIVNEPILSYNYLLSKMISSMYTNLI